MKTPRSFTFALLFSAAMALLASCSSTPTVYSNWDKSINLAAYRTYGFYPQLGTDKEGYSTLVTKYFKTAVTREMDVLGYKYTDKNPDLLVNFAMSIEDKSRIESSGAGIGYYSYRHGLYGTWPLYDQEFRTVEYKKGTANIDLIDARKKQLVWESIIEGRLTKKAMDNAEETISNAVAEMFKRHPFHRETEK